MLSQPIEDILWRQQIKDYQREYGTQIQPFTVDIPDQNTNKFEIGKKFPTNIAWIYGVSLKVTGVGPNDETLITRVDAAKMFLNLQEGSYFFIQNYPLDWLIYVAGTGAADTYRDNRYLPVKISGRADLDTSFIGNPSGVVQGTIVLYFWYLGSPTGGD